MSCVCDMCGVNHTHVGFLDSTCVYMHIQFLHTRVHAHAVFIHVCVFTLVHACMANVAS